MMLVTLPLPEWAVFWRPPWVALVLIYWCMAVPQRIGVAIAFLLGLALDVLTGALLGQHPLALCLVAYLTHKFHLRVRVFTPWQQGIGIFVLILMYQGVLLWVHGVQGHAPPGSSAWTVALSAMVLWPWVFVMLRDVRRRYDVA
jgi:rod shape-determining protein MreD